MARALAGIRARVESPSDPEYFALLAQRGPSIWFHRFGCTTGEASELLEDLVHTPTRAGTWGRSTSAASRTRSWTAYL